MGKFLVSTHKTNYPKGVKEAKLPKGTVTHKYDVDHNKFHGTPHVHLENGTVLNIFTGLIYAKKKCIGSMPKKKLKGIRLAIMESIVDVAQGKFNLDQQMVFVHSDKQDPLPTQIHVHTDKHTFATDKKVYDVGTQNSDLKAIHKKLDSKSIPSSLFKSISIPSSLSKSIKEFYTKKATSTKMPPSLINKLKILIESTNISRDFFEKYYNIDFESHDIDIFS